VAIRGAALVLLLAVLPAGSVRAAEEEVTVHLALAGGRHGSAGERARMRDLEYALMAALAETGTGRFVRDAWPAGACLLVLAGPDADAVWAAVEDTVRALPPRAGSYATLRRGPPGAPEERIDLGPEATPRP
jgi:hypothetical protein